jgi:signal transduction histidine kinase
MTAEGASGGGGHWVMRPWIALQRLSSRTSLRIKLISALVALVIFALAALGMVGISILRGYLLGPYDGELQNAGGSPQIASCVQAYLSGDANCRADVDIYWLTSSGQLEPVWTLQPNSYFGYQPAQNSSALPDLSGITTWLRAHTQQPTTIPAQSGGDRWRAVGFTEPAINLQTGAQSTGTIIVATDVTTVYSTIQKLIWMDVIVSAGIICVLAIVGFAVVQANLRPLVDIEETAGEIADGHLNRRVPERDPRTEIGSLGRSLNTMLSQIESAFHAREESEAAAHQSEAAAHQSEERMRRFIADASHELRTPLTAIRGFAEYYRQRGGLVPHWDMDRPDAAGTDRGARPTAVGLTPPDLDRIMQRVEKEAARMGLLVEDLLMLARLDQQRPLAHQPIDLLSLAADAVHDARMLAPDRTIELSVQPGAAFLVTGDEPRLRQVIGNLMSNALTHTPDGTPIEVSIGSGILDPRVDDPTPAAILDVTDHGPGMTPEQAHRVFERFYRADQARTRTHGGSGLGLAIVSALVAAHGGVASLRTAPGRGTTFRVTLPLDPDPQGGLLADDDDDADFDQLGSMAELNPADSGSGGFGPTDPGLDDEADGVSVAYGTSVGAAAGKTDAGETNAW